MKESKLYCCFSLPQKKFLESKGFKHEIKALNDKTKCTMWVYIKDEEFCEALKEWSLGKN